MILAAKIVTARDHENADRLRVYTVEAPGIEVTQIIANKDTLYEVGDTAAAALIGTMMSDGTVIEKSKIRGVLSFGMLLGKTPEPPGTDLTERMGAKHVEKKVDESQGVVDESNWPRYTSIDGLLRVRDEILAVSEVVVSEKIHGCFSAQARVMLPNGEERPISDIVDDPSVTHVLTYDLTAGEFRPARVTGRRRVKGHGQRWLKITLENGREIICTPQHPFYSRTRKAWIRAEEIGEFEDIESPVS
jgi:tRNA-binding EMAP/Myf-like protein